MSNDLLRQRRNLIIISALLFFLKYAGIEITEFSIVGVKFSSFKNPSSIFTVLWIAWTYFAVRYYQYFVQEGWPSYKSTFIKILDQVSIKKIFAKVKEKHPNNYKDNVTYSILKEWHWVYHGEQLGESDGMGPSSFEKFEMKFPKGSLLREIFYSIFCSIINRSAFTDYFLPFIVAITAFIYCFTGWDGSVIMIIKQIVT